MTTVSLLLLEARVHHSGTGGMITKLHAAKIATNAYCEMVIANGSNPDILYDIVDGSTSEQDFDRNKRDTKMTTLELLKVTKAVWGSIRDASPEEGTASCLQWRTPCSRRRTVYCGK